MQKATLLKNQFRTVNILENTICIDYFSEEKDFDLGNIDRFCEIILQPNVCHSVNFKLNQKSYILPLFGSLSYQSNENTLSLEPNQFFSFQVDKESSITFENLDHSEICNFLVWIINTPENVSKTELNELNKMSHGKLDLAYEDERIELFLGIFQGRQEIGYSEKNQKLPTIIVSVTGAFEVEKRLIESRDCLIFENYETLEIEALSNQALLLLLKSKFTQ